MVKKKTNYAPTNGLVVLLWLMVVPFLVEAQDSILVDTSLVNPNKSEALVSTRFVDMSDKLLLSSGFVFKSYDIEIKNVSSGGSVSIEPTGSANMGFGFNYRWFGFGFSFGLPNSSAEEKLYGETNKLDLQLNIYSKAFVAQGHFQRYKGFHISGINPGDTSQIQIDVGDAVIPSLETYSIGLSGWYFLNHKKFSYKAAYVRNAIQTRSAGSPIGGLYYGLDEANAGTNIGTNLPDSIKNKFDVLGYSSQTFGVSLGYSYTLVIKKFFVNGTIVPGLGFKNVSLTTNEKTFSIEEGVTHRIVFNMALGYEAKHFLLGLRAFTSSRLFEANGLRIKNGTNSVTIFVGKRFDVDKWIKKK